MSIIVLIILSLGTVNALVGPSGSGKSTIADADRIWIGILWQFFQCVLKDIYAYVCHMLFAFMHPVPEPTDKYLEKSCF